MFAHFLTGVIEVMSLGNILLIIAGTALGIMFGAIPGLTPAMAIALCLPMTFNLEIVSSMCLLIGLYLGGVSGGLISAILLRIPGTAGSLATTFDGHPMATQGKAGKALAAGIIFSFLGGLFSIMILLLVAPQLAEVAVRITPFDYFSIILFSLTLVGGLAGKSLIKGLLSCLLGLCFSFVGSAPIDGVIRYTMGIRNLNGGFVFLPVMIGLYAVSQILNSAEDAIKADAPTKITSNVGKVAITWKEFTGQTVNFLRSSVIGTIIGILPGIGGGTSNLIAYTAARSSSKEPEKFGTGILDGVVAPETANNAAIGGAMIPLLCLGIPGDVVTAILIGAFMIQGITPGPMLFTTQPTLLYSIFTALIISNIAMIVLELLFLKGFIKVLNIPKHILLPGILCVCAIGAIGANNRVFDIFVILLFGILAFLITKFEYPVPPLVMGFILGPMLETNLRRGLIFSKGSIVPFFTHPLSCIMIILSVLSIVFTVVASNKKVKRVQNGQ